MVLTKGKQFLLLNKLKVLNLIFDSAWNTTHIVTDMTIRIYGKDLCVLKQSEKVYYAVKTKSI
jgi:hypothetical protein